MSQESLQFTGLNYLESKAASIDVNTSCQSRGKGFLLSLVTNKLLQLARINKLLISYED